MVVRLENNTIVEIFPKQIETVEDVEKWYSKNYAKQSMATDQAIELGMIYNNTTSFFQWPDPPPPSLEELLNILMGVEHNG